MSKQTNIALAINQTIANLAGAKTLNAKKAAASSISKAFRTKVEKLCAKYGIEPKWLVIEDGAGNTAFIGEDGLDRLMVFFASTEIKDMEQFQQLNTYTQISALMTEGETTAEETAPVELVVVASIEVEATTETETNVTEVAEVEAEVVLALPEFGKPVQDANGDWIFKCVRSGQIGYAQEFFVPTYDEMRREMQKSRVDFVDLPWFAIHQDAVSDEEMPKMRLLVRMAESISAEEERIAKAKQQRQQQEEEHIELAAKVRFYDTVVIGDKGKKWKGVEVARCVNKHGSVGPLSEMRVPRLPAMYARYNGRYPTEAEMREELLCCPLCHGGEGMPFDDAITAIARIQVAALLKR